MTRTGLYKAIWRWHFYAGLFTLPFLVLLASTGAVYLFKDEINQLRYAKLLNVAPRDVTQPASSLVQAGMAGRTGTVVGYMPPATRGSSARVVVKDESGVTRFVFVDPYRGTVLGELERGQFGNLPLMELVRSLHSLEIAGWPGNRLVEIVAGWAVILVLTGLYLWWPRGQGGVLVVRRKAGRRVFWRDLHAVTGVFVGGLILLMALTGMPWSGFWGEHLKHLVNQAGWGYPPGYWFPVAQSDPAAHHELVIPSGWTLEGAPLPASAIGVAGAIDLDTALGIFTTAGMPAGFAVNFPMGPTGVWSASVMPDQIEQARTMHLDRYTGKVLADIRYADLGRAAKVIEWGVSVHTGQQFGRINQMLMLLTCIAIAVMAVAAVLMWWKRRPAGRLGAPAYDSEVAALPVAVLIPVVAGLVFPLVGFSILVVLAVDAMLPRVLRARLN